MKDNYAKFDFFDNDIIYVDKNAQKIYIEIILKGKDFFLQEEFNGYMKDVISDLFKKIREYHKSETLGYSVFSRIDVKASFFEKLTAYKLSNFINNSISEQNEYKKHLLNALNLMYHISLYKKSGYNSKELFKPVASKYYFLAFLDMIYLQEVYEGLVNEVDLCIEKLSKFGLRVDIDFENGFISTNGLKYSFLKETSISIDFQYKNPYPRIFKNKSCYDLFLWLKDNFVVNEYADYSHIFYEMLKRSLIYKIPHSEYIQFLFDELNVELNNNRLKSSAKIPINKNNTFKNGIDIIKPFSTVI
jgi:hypothetical protein